MTWRLLAPAVDDLDRIEDWVLSNFGEAAAVKAVSKLLDTFQMLADFPLAGIERPDVASPPIRFFSSPPNWIAYEAENPLIIHRILPARMDIANLNLPL